MPTVYDNRTGRMIARTVLENAVEVGATLYEEIAAQVMFELTKYPDMMPEEATEWDAVLEVYNEVCTAE